MKFQTLNDWLNEKEDKKPDPSKNIEDKKYGCVMMEAKIPDWDEYHTGGIE